MGHANPGAKEGDGALGVVEGATVAAKAGKDDAQVEVRRRRPLRRRQRELGAQRSVQARERERQAAEGSEEAALGVESEGAELEAAGGVSHGVAGGTGEQLCALQQAVRGGGLATASESFLRVGGRRRGQVGGEVRGGGCEGANELLHVGLDLLGGLSVDLLPQKPADLQGVDVLVNGALLFQRFLQSVALFDASQGFLDKLLETLGEFVDLVFLVL
jgi:hypothetical protein